MHETLEDFEEDAGRMLDELYAIGAQSDGGTYRSLYDASWVEARELIKGWMAERGLEVRIDPVGNIIGRLQGTTDAPIVATGSHMDTVRNGGRLDGAYGVVGSILAVGSLGRKLGKPARTLEVIVLCEEEGSRFTNHYWGSRSIVGETTLREAEESLDKTGVSLASAMQELGLDPREISSAKRNDIGYFVELHVEQGGILENEGLDLALVTAITGITRWDVTVTGEANHAGTTPMNLRRDALAGVAQMISDVENAAKEAGPPAVATVGRLSVTPDQINVVPGQVRFTVELRTPDRIQQLATQSVIERSLAATAAKRDLGIELKLQHDHEPVLMNVEVMDAIKETLNDGGVPYRPLSSGAGHDTQLFSQIAKVGMIFTSSKGGLSHTPLEDTDPRALGEGVSILAGTLLRLAYKS
ncbi:Zn-dependent hydrolase [Arthrobacter sp. NicSoilB8]|uniref:Zn-dependent hydrolase n=1 Tax=Arthrobacter sp. NicSoilB8 TaxID=2830998 RepID=UPI001CC73D8B|nr:Zn-dependent hydrolase [Arthrobacter sp. NicSoilB8]BCW73505.1 Zn-dependent hydrolase [Arthrobacter sp. NicSoilB8]BCW73563.1 Zn-dependent hydrolase [Arthrobacter sp. NicSoilB8]